MITLNQIKNKNMDEEILKIGDPVKIIQFEHGDKLGTVTEVTGYTKDIQGNINGYILKAQDPEKDILCNPVFHASLKSVMYHVDVSLSPYDLLNDNVERRQAFVNNIAIHMKQVESYDFLEAEIKELMIQSAKNLLSIWKTRYNVEPSI